MKLPRWFRRWRRKRRETMRGPMFARLWHSVAAPVRNGWAWISEARAKRSLRNLWWGLPAVVLGASAIILGTLAHLREADAEAAYLRLAVNSHKAGEFDKARLFLERVYRSGDSSQEIRFLLASTLDGQGESQRARAILESLSPEEGEPGYPEAHLLKARWLLRPIRFASEDEARRALRHLVSCQSQFGETAEWLHLAAKYALMTGNSETGLDYLRRAARLDLSYQFELAMLAKDLGRADGPDELQRARSHLEAVLQQKPRNQRARLSLSTILSAQGELRRAFEVLSDGLALTPDGPFASAMSQVCLAQFDELLASEDTRPDLRLQLLQRALKYDRKSIGAVRRLAYFGEESSSSLEVKRAAREYLEAMVATGRESPIAHLALGTKAWQDGNEDVAAFHLRRAYELDSGLARLANDLAWVLAHQEMPELDHALQIMNTLITDYPRNAHFRDTRGQILAKLEQWPEALQDLEFALRSMPENADLHSALSNVYKNTVPPRPGLAKKHATLAASLRNRRNP